jgi:integrase
LKLASSPEPYWRTMETGRAVGYRRLKGGKPGRWIARAARTDGAKGYTFESLGDADDYSESDGIKVLSFAEAQQAARSWFAKSATAGGKRVDRITVAEAVSHYVDDYISRSDRATKNLRNGFDAHILPAFGARKVCELTSGEIKEWLNRLVQQPPQRRKSKTGKPQRSDNTKASATLALSKSIEDPAEAKRKRQASANRILTRLKAALNHAFHIGLVSSDLAWRRVHSFKNADQPRIRYLSDEEATRLVNACPTDFKAIVVAALLTGADYGELRTSKVRHLDPVTKTLTVSKKRGTHAVGLTEEAVKHLTAWAQGKTQNELLLTRSDGMPWEDSHQVRRMAAACGQARISPAINFHILRHTFATRALRNGANMHYVSNQLGHKNIRTTQKHYAHVIPSDSVAAIRKAMGDLTFDNDTARAE